MRLLYLLAPPHGFRAKKSSWGGLTLRGRELLSCGFERLQAELSSQVSTSILPVDILMKRNIKTYQNTSTAPIHNMPACVPHVQTVVHTIPVHCCSDRDYCHQPRVPLCTQQLNPWRARVTTAALIFKSFGRGIGTTNVQTILSILSCSDYTTGTLQYNV